MCIVKLKRAKLQNSTCKILLFMMFTNVHNCRTLGVGVTLGEVVNDVVDKMTFGVGVQLIDLGIGVYTISDIATSKVNQHLTTMGTNVIMPIKTGTTFLGFITSGLGSENNEN